MKRDQLVAEERLEHFMSALGYHFQERELLLEALSHSSFANESSDWNRDNERLEFLGDAILEAVVSRILYQQQTALPEGRMTRIRADLVCEKSLAQLARGLGLGEVLILGKGEELSGGRDKDSYLADALEAVFAAISLDSDFETAAACIQNCYRGLLDQGLRGALNEDYKTKLYILIQSLPSKPELSFVLLKEEGPVHARLFTMAACVNGQPRTQGQGRTKKMAEQEAAMKLYQQLQAKEGLCI